MATGTTTVPLIFQCHLRRSASVLPHQARYDVAASSSSVVKLHSRFFHSAPNSLTTVIHPIVLSALQCLVGQLALFPIDRDRLFAVRLPYPSLDCEHAAFLLVVSTPLACPTDASTVAHGRCCAFGSTTMVDPFILKSGGGCCYCLFSLMLAYSYTRRDIHVQDCSPPSTGSTISPFIPHPPSVEEPQSSVPMSFLVTGTQTVPLILLWHSTQIATAIPSHERYDVATSSLFVMYRGNSPFIWLLLSLLSALVPS